MSQFSMLVTSHKLTFDDGFEVDEGTSFKPLALVEAPHGLIDGEEDQYIVQFEGDTAESRIICSSDFDLIRPQPE